MKIFLMSVYTSLACYDTHKGIRMALLMYDLLKSQPTSVVPKTRFLHENISGVCLYIIYACYDTHEGIRMA